jgi:hypothetical protein
LNVTGTLMSFVSVFQLVIFTNNLRPEVTLQKNTTTFFLLLFAIHFGTS